MLANCAVSRGWLQFSQLRDRLWLELSIADRAQNAQKDGQNKACHVDLDL